MSVTVVDRWLPSCMARMWHARQESKHRPGLQVVLVPVAGVVRCHPQAGRAYAHIMGRTAYEAISGSMTTSTDHPFAPILNAGHKVVFSRTLKTADWANTTTIAAGDTAEEIDKLRQGGDGHIVVWGGVSLWRSLMRLDLIDELQLSLFPYVAGEGTRLFDGVPNSYQLDLVSSTASSNGIVELQYRRHR